MWIRFWWQGKHAAAPGPIDVKFVYYSRRPSDESLDEELRERGDREYGHLERGYRCGFDRIRVLPRAARLGLIDKYERIFADAKYMLSVLGVRHV